jgi:hypothetical protein
MSKSGIVRPNWNQLPAEDWQALERGEEVEFDAEATFDELADRANSRSAEMAEEADEGPDLDTMARNEVAANDPTWGLSHDVIDTLHEVVAREFEGAPETLIEAFDDLPVGIAHKLCVVMAAYPEKTGEDIFVAWEEVLEDDELETAQGWGRSLTEDETDWLRGG